jgi:hypothetical protein
MSPVVPLHQILSKLDFELHGHKIRQDATGHTIDVALNRANEHGDMTVLKANVIVDRNVSVTIKSMKSTALVTLKAHDHNGHNHLWLEYTETDATAGMTVRPRPLQCHFAQGYSIEDFWAGRSFVAHMSMEEQTVFFNALASGISTLTKHRWQRGNPDVSIHVKSCMSPDAYEPFRIARMVYEGRDTFVCQYRAHLDVSVYKVLDSGASDASSVSGADDVVDTLTTLTNHSLSL